MQIFSLPTNCLYLLSVISGVVSSPVPMGPNGFQSPIGYENVPSIHDGARVARTLVARESLVNVNTFQTIENKGVKKVVPVSSMEYYADCDLDGDPYWLVVDIGSTFQNIKKGSEYTFTIRVGDHPIDEEVDLSYPGSIKQSPAGSPRVNLRGQLKDVTFNNPIDELKLEACFLKRHPDSKWWLPNNKLSPHGSHWVKFIVDEVYVVGGFGNMAYIGTVDGELYHKSEIIKPST